MLKRAACIDDDQRKVNTTRTPTYRVAIILNLEHRRRKHNTYNRSTERIRRRICKRVGAPQLETLSTCAVAQRPSVKRKRMCVHVCGSAAQWSWNPNSFQMTPIRASARIQTHTHTLSFGKRSRLRVVWIGSACHFDVSHFDDVFNGANVTVYEFYISLERTKCVICNNSNVG